jgi:5-methylthioadenosine/S-adenosylhomocysteine deaminase
VSSLRIRNATILTQDDQRRVVMGDLYVEDGTITAMGAGAKQEAERELDGTGQVVMPGLINLHTHLPMGLLRGYGDDLPLEEWLHTRIWPAEEHFDEKTMRAGADLGCLESISNGVTSFLDMYFLEREAVWPAVQQAGLRAWLGEGMVDIGRTPEGEPHAKLPAIERFVKATRDDPLVTACPAPHATYTCHAESYAEAARIAAEYEVPMHTHCSETRTEVHDVEARFGVRPVERLASAGALGPRSVLAHAGWVTKAEVRTIAQAGAAVAHCPVSNMKLATGGVCPVPELQDEGVRVGLGTDGAASNNGTDMFETMKFAALVQKQHRWDARALPAQAALDMATRDAADALGRPDLGRLVVGAPADLVMVDFRRPGLVPRHSIQSHLVYAARGSDVSATVVAGRVLMAERRCESLDAAAVLRRAQEMAHRVATKVQQGS